MFLSAFLLEMYIVVMTLFREIPSSEILAEKAPRVLCRRAWQRTILRA